jgi:hypothetical protein
VMYQAATAVIPQGAMRSGANAAAVIVGYGAVAS